MRPSGPQFLRVDESSIGLYLRDIARYKPLTSREESEAAVKIRKGDHSALQRLVMTNLRFVVSVARNYQHQGMALSDLINEGNLGLIRAAKRFDETKNFKFISYAVWWIRQAILQSLAEHSRILRIPLNRVGDIYRVGKARSRLEQRFRRAPDAGDIADELGIKPEDVERSFRIGTNHTSLDAPVGGESGEALVSVIRDDSVELPDAFMSNVSYGSEVTRLLEVLPERDREVVSLYFGIGDGTTHTLDEIGERLAITRERVRQIKEKAMGKLRRSVRSGEVVRVAE